MSPNPRKRPSPVRMRNDEISADALCGDFFDYETSTNFGALDCEICYIHSCSLDFFAVFVKKIATMY